MSKISGLLLLSVILMSCHPEEEEVVLMNDPQLSGSIMAANRIRVDNIKELKEVSVPEGRRREVEVLGYYEPGDGGGGTFYWNHAAMDAEDGGIIFKAIGIEKGRWQRKMNGEVSVRWFGISPTVEDNALMFNKIMDLADIDEVVVPKGVYIIKDTWRIEKTGLIIKGEGTIKYKGSGKKNIIDIINASNLTIKGITIEGTGMISPLDHTTQKSHSIGIWSGKNILIEDVEIFDSGKDGIYINEMLSYIPGEHGRDITINNCRIERVTRNAISVIAGENIQIKNSIFSEFQLMGVDLEPNPSNTHLSKITVEGCKFYGELMRSSALQARGTASPKNCSEAEFIDNVFYGNQNDQNSVLRISHFPKSLVSGNVFFNVGKTAILVEGSSAVIKENLIEGKGNLSLDKSANSGAIALYGDYSEARDNVIKNVSGNGIFSSGNNSRIEGNLIFNPGSNSRTKSAYGIYLWDASDILIQSNKITSDTVFLDTGIKFRIGTNHAINTTIINNVIENWQMEKISREYLREQKDILNN